MKTSLDISCELSAKQKIHMKYQDLFSLKNKKIKILECCLLQILLGALRVNCFASLLKRGLLLKERTGTNTFFLK